MPIAIGIAAAGVAGGVASMFGSSRAAKQQDQAARNAFNLQNTMFREGLNRLDPIVNRGSDAMNTLMKLVTPGANMTETLNQIPGFQFLQDWGQRAVKNIGSTRGLGGNVGTALSQFATGTAQSQAWQPLMNMLFNIGGMGKDAATSIMGASNTFGQTGGNSLIQSGNAQAAGTMGTTNALSNIFSSLANASILNSSMSGGGGAWGNVSSGGPGSAGATVFSSPFFNW